MSCMGTGSALKTAAGSSERVVSALRNHIHYVVNYVFEGRRPRDLRGEVVVSCLRADLGQIRRELTVLTPNIRHQLPLMTYH